MEPDESSTIEAIVACRTVILKSAYSSLFIAHLGQHQQELQTPNEGPEFKFECMHNANELLNLCKEYCATPVTAAKDGLTLVVGIDAISTLYSLNEVLLTAYSRFSSTSNFDVFFAIFFVAEINKRAMLTLLLL